MTELQPDPRPQLSKPAALGQCERGTSTIEYAVLAAGIAVAIVAALGGLGEGVSGTWSEVDTAVPGPTIQTGGGNAAI